MSVAQDLEKLSSLREAGYLSDGEFATAKQRIMAQAEDGNSPVAADDLTGETFRSSRWSSRNFFFPDRLTVAPDGIIFRKGAMFGSREEHIGFGAIASYRTENGVFLATMTIETSGGTQPIVINGLWKSAARRIQELIRIGQGRRE
ncbi:MAG TPA: hypothetical protein VHD32_11540 [Candidatus Didemnitutus sp.]|nr:hypothetical protein [Candidatus Didemnitutus sp.]